MDAYDRFAKSKNIRFIQLKSGKEKKGIYNIQRINYYLTKHKKFMAKFNGVVTKYLNNYLVWHTWFHIKAYTQLEKADLLLVKAMTRILSVPFRQLAKRPSIPLNI